MFPTPKEGLRPFKLVFGEERGVAEPHTLDKPMLIAAMSYGALGENAVRALARGAAMAGITMNTGEGGYPKYHLMEQADLIFQLGTAKSGVRHEDGSLDEKALQDLAAKPQVKMIEIKFSQGAKPGKGGLLPKEKITPGIAALRRIPLDRDAVSPAYHSECTDLASTVAFIARIQARECGDNTCPIGITTHDPKLQADLVPAVKALRIRNYVRNTIHEFEELTVAMGRHCPSELTVEDLFVPTGTNLWRMIAALLLLIPFSAAWGAILAWGLMTGAIIGHCTHLGLTGDMLPMTLAATFNWLGSCAIVLLRHRQIEFIRCMFECDTEQEEP